MAKAVVRIHRTALRRIIETDPRAAALVRRKAIEVVEAAKAVFDISQRWDNESETSQNTPPKYRESFYVERMNQPGVVYHAGNSDPGWNMVEYGAHAGGKTFVLRYRPLARGLDIVAARHAGR